MRKAREISETNIYHVILRGVNRQNTFFEETDYTCFISLMYRYCEKLDMKIISYTLMSNHVHIQVKVCGEYFISELVKRICVSYTRHYFNRKYNRVGSLFQSRFVSRAVRDESDVLTLSRYILNNPKHGAMKPFSYKYSSLKYTLNAFSLREDDDVMDTEVLRDSFKDQDEFIRFLTSQGEVQIESEDYLLNDIDVFDYMNKVSSINGLSYLAQMVNIPELFTQVIRNLLENRVSVRRISRISGIPRGIITSYA